MSLAGWEYDCCLINVTETNTMRIAAIGDIHGNSAALEAVLRDIDRCEVDRIVNVGDHFSGPLDARGTADLLQSRDIISIRGNHDRWLIEQKQSEMGCQTVFE